MVRTKTSLELINEFTITNNLRLMKKWSTRYAHQRSPSMSGHVTKLIKKIRDLLNLISGNDITEMIKSNSYCIINLIVTHLSLLNYRSFKN
jgi:hypothetical protein